MLEVRNSRMEIIRYGYFVRADLCRNNQRWSEEEIEFLRKYYGKIPAWKIGLILGRSRSSVRHKARSLGLKASLGPYPKFLRSGSSPHPAVGEERR